MKPSVLKRSIAVLLSDAFLEASVMAPVAEANFWADRKKAAAARATPHDPRSTNHEPLSFASLPASALPLQVLKGLPELRPAALSASARERLKADVPASVLDRHQALLAAIPAANGTIDVEWLRFAAREELGKALVVEQKTLNRIGAELLMEAIRRAMA